MLFVLIIIYISTGLIYDLQIREQNRLENTLLRVRTKYNMQLLEYREFSNYQNLIRQLERHNLDLEEPATPPLKVKK
jgi:hypothetical protein